MLAVLKLVIIIVTYVSVHADGVGGIVQIMDSPAICEDVKAKMVSKLAADPDMKRFAVECRVMDAPEPLEKA